MRSDDIAPLLVPPPPPDDVVRWGTGTVIDWDSETGTNTIRWRGADLVNLPIISASAWVLQVEPGDTVGLNIIGSGGAATVYIVGPITQPGPEVRDLIRSTIASRIVAAVDATEGTRSLSTFGDLTGASSGPSVTIDIGPSGKALVLWAAQRNNASGFDTDLAMGDSIRVSGATSSDPSSNYTAGIRLQNATAGNNVHLDAARFHLFTGLNPGSTTFKMEYRSVSSDTCKWSEREIAVFAM